MPTPPEPRADHPPDRPTTGAHGLGPHVVGRRVVVRRLLRGVRGPTGGPAMTDLLGVCVAWGDGVCVVQPETGPAVEIATADIVSGKPVPPRPPTRLRVQPDEAQRRATALFPDLETAQLGGWTLRHSPTVAARRAHSVLAVQASGLPPEEAYAGVLDFYAARDARPIAAVRPDTAEEELFRAHGWVPESGDADTVFALAGVSGARRRLPRSGGGVRLVEEAGVATVEVPDPATSGTVAGGVAAVRGDWVGVRSVRVEPGHRRRGLGLVVMAALLEWGAEQGARTAYLQVLGDNEAALTLYERIGFVEHHRYRYLAAPPGGVGGGGGGGRQMTVSEGV